MFRMKVSFDANCNGDWGKKQERHLKYKKDLDSFKRTWIAKSEPVPEQELVIPWFPAGKSHQFGPHLCLRFYFVWRSLFRERSDGRLNRPCRLVIPLGLDQVFCS